MFQEKTSLLSENHTVEEKHTVEEERKIEESLACSAEAADKILAKKETLALQSAPQSPMPSSETAIQRMRKDHKFTYASKGDLTSIVRTYFMLGTDTSYDDQRGYPDGEIFSAFFNMLKEAIIVDGPKQDGAFCANANEVPSHTVGLILSDLSQSPIEILNLGGHSRGAVGTLIIAHELDRIKNALNPPMDSKAIREAVLNSTDPDTKKILTSETAHFNDGQWQELAKNIAKLKLNLFLLDPVPGNYRLSSGYRWQDPRICKADHFEVPNIVENIYVQYAGDERTHQFDTIRVKHVNPEFKRLTLDLLPGHHGTVSGNITDRGTLDKSSFIHFYAELKNLLLDATNSPTAAAALNPDAVALQSPAIKSQIDQCITDCAGINWDEQEKRNEALKKLIWDLINKHFDESFISLIIKIKPDTMLTAKEFTSKIYLSIRGAFNSAQKITTINMLEYFIKHSSLSANDFVEAPIKEELFGNQYQTFNEFLPLIFDQERVDSGVLTALDIKKLKIYDVLSILKKTFISFRKSYYDSLGPFSSDHIVLGRQVRCGLTWGSLQDYVSIFHDDSPYVNSDHADLIYKHAFDEVAKCQESQDNLLTPNIHKITLLLHKIILVSNNAKQRHAVMPERKTVWDYIPLFFSSTKRLDVKIDNSKLNHFKELLSSYLTEILFTNDKDSIHQLFEIVKQIILFDGAKQVLFNNEAKFEDKDQDDKRAADKRAALLGKITKDSEGNVIEPEEHFKEALQTSIIDATSQALKNLEEQVKVDRTVILGLWQLLKEAGQKLTNEEKETYYSTIEQNIHKVLKTLIFIKDNNLKCSQGFLGELQQPKNELLDILSEILIKKQELISSLTEEIRQKEQEVIDKLNCKDSEILKHARSFEKKEKELEETRNELSKKEADLKVIKIEYEVLSEKQDKATVDLHAIQADLEATAAKLATTEENLNEIKDRLENANEQLKQAHETNESLLNERDRLRLELDAILEENKILKTENADLKEQIKTLQITMDVQALESEKVKQLEAKIAEQQAQINGWQDENARKSVEALKILITQYDSHLNHSNQGALKRKIMNDLRVILEENITPRDKVDQCRALLCKEETKSTLSQHRDSKFIRFLHDCLRILCGVAFYQKLSGQSPAFFNRPSHGERFVQQSEQILTPSA